MLTTLAFKNLAITFGHRVVLKEVNASISSGEFIAILGANGAGKSSLLRAILGLLKISEGQLHVLGKQVKKGSPDIGYMPQVRPLLLNNQLNGKAWLKALASGHRWGLPWLSQKQCQEIELVINLVQAESFIYRPFNRLSGGERQRLLLAQALLNHPKILLLDEPLVNLDLYYQEALVELIQSIRLKFNITILFTSHDINPLVNVVDRVMYLGGGKALIGSVDEIITSEKLSALYGTEISVVKYENRLLVLSKEIGCNDHHGHCHPYV